VYYLLTQDRGTLEYFAKLILNLKNEVNQCGSCYRFFSFGSKETCNVCLDSSRNNTQLMVVEKDADFETAKKINDYVGKFFILGGNVPILEDNPEKRIRINQLVQRINKEKEPLVEIILALSATREGDYTVKLIREILEPLAEKYNISITTLGRGLSTGIEIEYTDPDTISAALKNRS
jgi:recombination protein RecR